MSDEQQTPETLQAIADRIESLRTAIDERFTDVEGAFVEQRKYTEFAFGKLQAEMRGGFGRIEQKLESLRDGRRRT
jgi:hypothetical protein